jgi:hypothetical protein
MLKTSHSEIKGKMSKFLLFHLSQISQNIFIYLQKESEEDPDIDEIVKSHRSLHSSAGGSRGNLLSAVSNSIYCQVT